MNYALKNILIEPFNIIRRNISFVFIVSFILLVDQLKNVILPNFSFGKPQNSYTEWIYIKIPELLTSDQVLFTMFVIGIVTLPIICLGQLWSSSNLRMFYLDSKSKKLSMLGSLKIITISQIIWSIVNFLIFSSFFLLYEIFVFLICRLIWQCYNFNTVYLLFLLILALFPIYFAYISLSNKLILIDPRKTFSSWVIAWKDMLNTFSKFDKLWKIYIFYIFRVTINSLFKGAVPAASLFLIDNWFLRIFVASISMLAAHIYVKSSSFELFLFIYKDNTRIRHYFNSFYLYSYKEED